MLGSFWSWILVVTVWEAVVVYKSVNQDSSLPCPFLCNIRRSNNRGSLHPWHAKDSQTWQPCVIYCSWQLWRKDHRKYCVHPFLFQEFPSQEEVDMVPDLLAWEWAQDEEDVV